MWEKYADYQLYIRQLESEYYHGLLSDKEYHDKIVKANKAIVPVLYQLFNKERLAR